jgi:hypothetical protein
MPVIDAAGLTFAETVGGRPLVVRHRCCGVEHRCGPPAGPVVTNHVTINTAQTIRTLSAPLRHGTSRAYAPPGR